MDVKSKRLEERNYAINTFNCAFSINLSLRSFGLRFDYQRARRMILLLQKAHNQALKIGKWGWWFNGGNVKWARRASRLFQSETLRCRERCKKFNSCVNEYFCNQNFHSGLVRISSSSFLPSPASSIPPPSLRSAFVWQLALKVSCCDFNVAKFTLSGFIGTRSTVEG